MDKIREHTFDFIKKRLAPAGIPNDGRLCTYEQILKMRQNWYGAFEGERSACMLLEERMSDEDGNWINDLIAYESVVGSACLH